MKVCFFWFVVCVLFTQLTLSQLSVDSNTVALWHFDELSGSTIVDAGNHGNNGTVTGSTIVDGKFGKARNVAVNGDKIVVDNNLFGTGNGSYSIEMWINRQINSGGTQELWDQRSSLSGDPVISGSILSDNRFQAFWRNSSNTVFTITSNSVIPLNVWVHIAMVKDSVNQIVTIYINSKKDTTQVLGNIGELNSLDKFALASNYWNSPIDRGLGGFIDEVRISNKARTPDEFISNTYIVYPNQHTIIVDDSAKKMLSVKITSGGSYTVTTKFTSKPHAGGDIDGVFFWATTGEKSAQWPIGHAVYQTFHDGDVIKIYSPTGFDGYLFFMDGGIFSDNSGSVTVTFKLDSVTSVFSTNKEKIALQFNLSQNFPNPFNPSTKINYEINKQGNVKLNIYDIIGRNVKTLLAEFQPTGNYTITWDGRNEKGESVGSGTYFYQLTVGEYSETKKMILLK